jgi:DNA-directed RNA polymerase specialized sigma24 family protein
MPTAPSPLSFAAPPGSPDADALRARLGRGDPRDWPWILEELRAIAATLAPSFRDVCSADDVLGELALRAHERWLEDWLAAPSVPLRLFLRDRLRDHLRELRRQRQRRASLLSGVLPGEATVETDAGHHGALFSSPPPRPDEALEAEQLRRDVARVSGAPSQILDLRAAGFDQHEIAAHTGISRPTVGRRLATIAAVMAALATTGALLGAHRWPERAELHVVPITALQAEPGAPPAPARTQPTPPEPRSTESASTESASTEPVASPSTREEIAAVLEEEGSEDTIPMRTLEPPAHVRRILGDEPTRAGTAIPGSTPGRTSLPARTSRWLAPLEECPREEGATASIELTPHRAPIVSVRGFDVACVHAVAVRDAAAWPPVAIERLHFVVVENRRVEARATAPLPRTAPVR